MTNKIVRKEVLDGSNEKQEVSEQNHDNTENLLNKIKHLEKAAKNDAKEIDKLVMKLKEILTFPSRDFPCFLTHSKLFR